MDAMTDFMLLMVLLLISSNNCSEEFVPTFVVEPSSVTLFEGQNMTLTCKAGPCCNVTMRWMYNGTYHSDTVGDRRVAGSIPDTSTLTINTRGAGFSHDVEIYQCVATNRLGSVVSRPAVVAFARGGGGGGSGGGVGGDREEKLGNKSIHQTISAFNGSTIILPCRSAAKNLCLSADWELNGNHLKISSRHKVLPSKSLVIEGVIGSDVGTYRCLCYQSLVSHLSVFSSVHLKIEKSPANFTSKFVWTSSQNQQVVEGQTLTLECAAVGRPRPVITWLRYGGVLAPERHSQSSGVLHLRDVRKTDEGTYICRAENTAGPQQIYVVFVDVLQPPKIVSPPMNQETAVGNRVTFSCKSRALPRQTVTWYHNAVRLVDSATIRINADGTLVIMEAGEIHAGIYQCMVTNSVNSTSASARLVVHSNDRGTGNHHRQSGVDYNKDEHNFPVQQSRRPMSISVTSPSAHLYDWENRLPGSATETTPETRLMQSDGAKRPTRKKSNPRDPRTYQVQKNVGQKQTGISLVPPSKPSVRVASDTSVELKWTRGHDIGLNVTLFKVQFKEIKSSKHRKSSRWQTIDEDINPDVTDFVVVNLRPGSTYQFRLVAIYSNNDNKHGPNSDQVLMSVTGQQAKMPLTAPIIVAVNPLSTSEISIKWQYMPLKREATIGFMILYKPYETSLGYKQFVVHGIDRREANLSNLLTDTTYSLRMQSLSSEGFSDYSNTAVKKTMGPSDNFTDIYPLQNLTPLYPAVDNNFEPNSNEDNDDEPKMHRHIPSTTPGAEYNVHLSRVTYAQQNKDLLFVVLGVVLGGVFIVIIFIVVFCFWRQRQQQLFIAAVDARSKVCDTPHAFHTDSLSVLELKNFVGEPIKSAAVSCNGKRTGNKKNHIPNYLENGCHLNSGSLGSRDYLDRGVCCQLCGPQREDCHLLQRHLSVSKSNGVCNLYCPKSNGMPMHTPMDHEFASGSFGCHSEASDGDEEEGVRSESHPPSSPADCRDIYNSERPQVSSFKSPSRAPSEICCRRPSTGDRVSDQLSCRRTSTLPLESAGSSPTDSIGCRRRSDSPDNRKRSCHSDRSSSLSSSSSLSACSYHCRRQPQCLFEKNDSGVYDEHSVETTSENKPQPFPCLAAADQNRACAQQSTES